MAPFTSFKSELTGLTYPLQHFHTLNWQAWKDWPRRARTLLALLNQARLNNSESGLTRDGRL